MAIGTLMAVHAVPNPWRVLNSQGKHAAGFRWTDSTNTDDPIALLRADGVRVSDDGVAHPSQRLSIADLAGLLGVQIEEPAEYVENAESRARFEAELASAQPPAVTEAALGVLETWQAAGGRVVYGSGQETSAILKAHPFGHSGFVLWCGAIYPSGSMQIWFQYLKTKEPFTDPAVREQLRQRLIASPLIDIPAGKLGLRPSFPLGVIADPDAAAALQDALAFVNEAARADSFEAVEQVPAG
jgi:hypothetical protein